MRSRYRTDLHAAATVATAFLIACSSSTQHGPPSDATSVVDIVPLDASPDANGALACDQVGTSLCARIYACYAAAEIAQLNYPVTETECVMNQNALCDQNKPGFCKGNPQTSPEHATACAAELAGMTCEAFRKPLGSGVCKTQLCQH